MSANFRSILSTIIIIAVIAAAAIIWYRFSASKPVEPVSSASALANNVKVGSQGLLPLLESLEGLSFNLSVLDNRLYKSLEDFTPDISAPEIIGRPNPFAPF